MKKQDAGVRMQESGIWNLDAAPESFLHPASSILRSKQQAQCATMFLGEDPCGLNPASLQRVRWRCRRGLLELDIVLGRFVEVHYAALTAREREIFEQFLDMADNPLWDLISGRTDTLLQEQNALLIKIKSV